MIIAKPRHIVLLGAGHTHALVLRRVSRIARKTGVKVTLISSEKNVPYSGMLSGVIIGIYTKKKILIDVEQLAHENDIEYISANATSIDLNLRQIYLSSGTKVSYDVLSINVGGHCKDAIAEEGGNVMPVKPVEPLLNWLDTWQNPKQSTCAVIGGGFAGVEVALALDARLRRKGRIGGVFIIGRNKELVPGMPKITKKLNKILCQRGISQILGKEAKAAIPGHVVLTDGSEYLADYVLACTGVRVWTGLAESGIEVDQKGCVVINQWLRSVSHPDVFASGDCASWFKNPLPKSGVYAVRQAKILAANLGALCQGRNLRSWQGDHAALSIINTGDKKAIAYRNGIVVAGRLVWAWKDHLDQKFMSKFN